MDQPCKVANPARGQLNKENNIPLSPDEMWITAYFHTRTQIVLVALNGPYKSFSFRMAIISRQGEILID